MTLHLHPCLTMPAVAEAAARLLRAPPPGDDPFATDVLVVGGRGVEQWLRLALAERLPIVANLEVRSPSRFVQDLERWATGEVPLSAAALTRDVLEAVQADPGLLPAELRHLRDPVGGAGAPPGEAGVVGAALASWAARMARTYERYQRHRHDWLLAWERGDTPADPTEAWQARLWRAIAAVAARPRAPAQVHEATRRALGSARATSLAPRWLLVHDGRLAPSPLVLARALATHREVHVLVHAASRPALALLTAPSPGTIPPLPPVTARLDRARLDALRLLRETLGATPVAPPAADADGASVVPASVTPASVTPASVAPASVAPVSASSASGAPASLLAAVQHALRGEPAPSGDTPAAGAPASVVAPAPAAAPPRAVGPSAPTDHSLRVYACHGALRQVEVLKDALLAALHDDPTLEPRDLLVLTPDPSRFVPLLQALLPLAPEPAASRGADPPPLPLHLQGRSPRAVNPVADLLLQLLALAESRVTASRVLALVERGPVAERFGIAASDAPLVREWFQAAGVRWGIDAADPERAELGLAEEGTWTRAWHRLLLGAAVLDGGAGANTHCAGYAPVPGLEGEQVLLAGRAARAVRLLLASVADARCPRPVAAWCAFLERALETLVPATGAYGSAATRVRELLTAMRRPRGDAAGPEAGAPPAGAAESAAGAADGAAGPVCTAGALAVLLEHRLEEVLTAPGRLGGVTVAPLAAGWVRPARLIALLGMDDDLFPRRGGPPWFDRMAAAPRPGDPDDRGDQLQTVFDAVCMAEDRLLVLYTGWNRAGTLRLPPSAAVAALADVVHAVAPVDGGTAAAPPGASPTGAAPGVADPGPSEDSPAGTWRRLVEREMPLQPFSRRAFGDAAAPAAGVPSFDALAARTAARLATRAAPRPTRRAVSTPTGMATPRRAVLPLASLLRFLAHPAEEILARLGVRPGVEAPLLDDVLSLTMPRREEAAAVVGLTDALLLGDPVEPHLDALRHRDRMPPGVLGRAWQHHARERAERLAARARAAVDDLPRRARATLRVDIGATVLAGSIERRHGERLLFLRDGRPDRTRLLAPFVTLCAAAVQDPTITHAVQVDAVAATRLACPGDPLSVLRDLVDLYHDADRAVPPYVPAAAFAYAASRRPGATEAAGATGRAAPLDREAHARALDAAQQAWAPDDPNATGEGELPANRLLHATSPVDHPSFATLALAVAGRVLAAAAEGA
jgi:exodeoxyribonuclease V gamma subunit